MRAAVELAYFLAFGHECSRTGGGEKSGNACATCADSFSQSSLRIQLELHLTAQHHLLERFVLADVGTDMFFDLPGLQKLSEAVSIDSGVVGNRGQVLDAFAGQSLDQFFRNATEPESADHDHCAVLNIVDRCISVGEDLVHK